MCSSVLTKQDFSSVTGHTKHLTSVWKNTMFMKKLQSEQKITVRVED